MVQRGRVTGRSSGRPVRSAGGSARPQGGGAPVSRARLAAAVEPVVAAAGYDLEELAVSRAGRRYVVRVTVDADGGVSLDAVAVVSRALSAALDEVPETGGELVPGEYTLEVSSPGVDRPLTLPRHWRRNVGRLVTVRAGQRQVTGRVLAADGAGVELEVDAVPQTVAHADLGPGRVQVEFSRPDEPDDRGGREEGEDEE
jgi:ribosome maturation factor RimP